MVCTGLVFVHLTGGVLFQETSLHTKDACIKMARGQHLSKEYQRYDLVVISLTVFVVIVYYFIEKSMPCPMPLLMEDREVINFAASKFLLHVGHCSCISFYFYIF